MLLLFLLFLIVITGYFLILYNPPICDDCNKIITLFKQTYTLSNKELCYDCFMKEDTRQLERDISLIYDKLRLYEYNPSKTKDDINDL